MSAHDTPASPAQQGEVQYRDVPGYAGYRVGDDGSVWSCRRGGAGYKTFGRWKRLKTGLGTSGYLSVTLCRGPGTKPLTRAVHVIVLEAFVGSCPPGKECCHDDDDKVNNRLGNLRWDTPKANAADARRNGYSSLGERNGAAKLTDLEVIEAMRLLSEGWSPKSVAQRFHVTPDLIRLIGKGKTRRHITAVGRFRPEPPAKRVVP